MGNGTSFFIYSCNPLSFGRYNILLLLKLIEGPISLILRDMDGNAHAENSSVIVTSGRKKEYQWRSNMVFSVRNFTTITNEGRGDRYFIEEIRGVMVHELTHSWQWSCSGMPGGLTEGTTSNYNSFNFRNCGFCEIESRIGTGSLE